MMQCKRVFALLLVLCMVIPMALITVNAETTIQYDFYYDKLTWEGKGLGKIMDSSSPNQAVLESAYANGTINFLPVAHAGYSVPYIHSKDNYQDNLTPLDSSMYNGIKINSKKVGDWFAFKIKNPGDGYFNVSVNVYNSVNSAMGANVYILSGVDEDAASIESELTAANLYGNVDFKRKDVQPYGNVLPAMLETPLNSKASDGDYIVVIRSTLDKSNSDTTGETQAYIWMTGLTLTKISAPSVTPTTPAPTTPAPTTPAPTNPAPTTPVTPSVPDDNAAYRLFHSSLTDLGYSANGDIALSKQQEVLNSLYASGAMDVIPIGDKTENVTYLNYGAASSGKFEFNGIKLQKAAIGDYVVLKFRSPGAGSYSINLDTYYLNANNAARLAVYLLPGNTAVSAIDGMLVNGNLAGYADISTNNTAKTACTVTAVSNAELEADKDYLMVLLFDRDNYQPDTGRVDMMLTGLTFGEGFIVEPAPFDPIPGEVALSQAVKAASYYRAATGVNPANGHDLLYLLFKGGLMMVFDLDDKTLYDTQNITHSTPFGTCFDPDGNLWVTGTGTFLIKYDPTTKTGVKYSFAKSDFFNGSTNCYGGIYVDGYVYFGYNGCFGRVNAATGEIDRISDKIRIDTTVASDTKYLGYPGIFHRDGYLYTAIHGDENGDQNYTSAIIKYEIATGQIVDWVDVRFATRIPKQEAGYGVSDLAVVNDLLIGTFSNRKPGLYIDISGDKMKLVESLEGFDTCFTNQFTSEINGKRYVTGYVDNEQTTRCIYEYDLATGKVTRLGEIVYITATNVNGGTASVTWDDKLPGTSIVTAQNNSATGMVDVIFYNPTTMETVIWEGVVASEHGTGMTLRALTSDDTGRYIYVGAYGTNQITRYDTVEKTFHTFLGTDHQTDSLTYYKDKLYIGNYHTGTITQLDPETGDVTPYFNLYDSVFQQERMFGITAGDNKVFCGTVPDASRTGGTLVWYDLEENRYYVAGGPNPEDCYYADYASFVVWHNCATGEVETFDLDGDGLYDYDILKDDKGDSDPTNDVFEQVIKGLIPTQCPNDLIYKNGYIYGCTTKANGDAVATVFDNNAVLFVYDVEAKKLVATYDVTQAIPGIENPASGYVDYIDAIAADPYEDGKFWGVVCDTLFSYTFDHATNTFSVTEELSLGKDKNYRHATSTWHSRTILFDGDWMYVGFHNNGIYMVNTADASKAYKISAYNPAGGMARGQDGNIYYISNQDSSKPITELCVFNIAEAAQPVVAQSVQVLIDALPETVTLDNASQVLSVYAMYNDLRDPAKNLITGVDKLNTAATAAMTLQAQNVDALIDAIGKVKLESEAAILAARNAYNALTESAKAKVTKLSVLEAAEAKLAELKAGGSDSPNGNITTIVIVAVAVVVVLAAVAVLVITRKKKAAAPNEEVAEEPKQDEA